EDHPDEDTGGEREHHQVRLCRIALENGVGEQEELLVVDVDGASRWRSRGHGAMIEVAGNTRKRGARASVTDRFLAHRPRTRTLPGTVLRRAPRLRQGP